MHAGYPAGVQANTPGEAGGNRAVGGKAGTGESMGTFSDTTNLVGAQDEPHQEQ